MNTRKEIIELLSSPEHFRTYLNCFDPEQEVGVSVVCWDCPLARFLKAKGISTEVFSAGIEDTGRQKIVDYADVPALEWVSHFVKAIDALHDNDTESVLATEALRVLEGIG